MIIRSLLVVDSCSISGLHTPVQTAVEKKSYMYLEFHIFQPLQFGVLRDCLRNDNYIHIILVSVTRTQTRMNNISFSQ